MRPLSLENAPATKSARGGSQSAVPATKSAPRGSQSAAVPAHGGSQSAVPATKSALQETSENSNRNGGTIPTMTRDRLAHVVPQTLACQVRSHAPLVLKNSISCVRYLSKMRLPRNLHMEVHKVLCLPRSLHMEVHKALRLPRNLRMEVHKVLCLPRNLHFKTQLKTLTTMEGRFRP